MASARTRTTGLLALGVLAAVGISLAGPARAATPPKVTFTTPANGTTSGGTTVTVTGTGFTGATRVTFDGIPAGSVIVRGDTSLTAVAPPHAAGKVDLRITGPGGTSATTSWDRYLYLTPGQTIYASPTAAGGIPALGAVTAGISADGTRVAFTASTDDLVAGDTNGAQDAFVRDVANGTTTRVSVAGNGTQANRASTADSISADGLTVSFTSYASNLIAADTNAVDDVYVKNIKTGKIVRASTGAGNAQANGGSRGSSLSADGTLVAFASSATNLVAGDGNGVDDVFVKNLVSGAVQRVSRQPDGNPFTTASSDTAISADGSAVAFVNAGHVYVAHLATGTVEQAIAPTGLLDAGETDPRLSGDAALLTFTVGVRSSYSDPRAGTTTWTDHYLAVENLATGVTTTNRWNTGRGRNAVLSADGSTLAFESGNEEPCPYHNGSCVSWSTATSILVTRLDTGNTIEVDTDSSGATDPHGAYAARPAVSGDGSRVAFDSVGALVPGFSNGVYLKALTDRPNLTVSLSVASPDTATMATGTPVTFVASVRNAGFGPTPAVAIPVAFRVGDAPNTTATVGTAVTPAAPVAPGASVEVRYVWTSTTGRDYATAVVDPDNAVTDENDNESYESPVLYVGLPALTLAAPAAVAPPVAGQPMRLTTTIGNAGHGTIPAGTTVRFAFALSGPADSADIPQFDLPLAADLPPGATMQVTTDPFTAPAAGTYSASLLAYPLRIDEEPGAEDQTAGPVTVGSAA